METALSVAALTGKRVLITGTTGFVGKVLLEKLLRDVPDIGRIVVLLRGNAAHPDAGSRMRAEVLSSSVFDTLRAKHAERFDQIVSERLHVVAGEVTQARFGLAADAFSALATSVDVVINVAASVNFREALDQALAINTFTLQHLSELAHAAGNIPLVHVSTCYVNGHHRGLIRETLAPPAHTKLPQRPDGSYAVDGLIAHLRRAIEAVRERHGEGEARSRALVALGIEQARRHGWNDTYTFTKWLGEQLAWQAAQGRTLAIVRPAIVESACREPQPGWIEGMKVGDAIVLAYARGKTRLFPARTAGIADIIPVDLVVNSIVLATAQALQQPGERRVYQASSSVRHPIRVGDYVRLCQTEMRRNSAAYPRLIRKPLTKPFRTVPRSLFLAYLTTAFAVASIANRIARWTGMTQGQLQAYEALETTRELAVVFSFYTSPRYVFDNSQLLALASRFSEADRRRFEVDPRSYNWADYITRVHLPGLERYAVKSNSSARDEAPAQSSSPTLAAANSIHPAAHGAP